MNSPSHVRSPNPFKGNQKRKAINLNPDGAINELWSVRQLCGREDEGEREEH